MRGLSRLYRQALGLSGVLLLLGYTTCWSGNLTRPRYSFEHDNLFWFVMMADIHIGEDFDGGTQDTDNLTWITTVGYDAIQPEFIVACGDLCDGTNGEWVPSFQHLEEWLTYQEILFANAMDPNSYHDLPGNHDAYGDLGYYHYVNYSMSGPVHQTYHHDWELHKEYGTYHFAAINTAGNDGWAWPFDNSGLDDYDLSFLDQSLRGSEDQGLTFVFGHHPLVNIYYGKEPFIAMLNTYNVSFYGHGHTHDYGCSVPYETPWTLHVNTTSLGKSPADNYQIIAVDNDGIIASSQTVAEFPIVIITAPLATDICTVQELRYKVPKNSQANPIRALVFDENPEAVTSVKYYIDEGNYFDLTRVDDGPVWEGSFDATLYDLGEHTLTVRARGSETQSSTVTFQLEHTECSDGIDNDGDGYIDLDDHGCDDLFGDNERGYANAPGLKLSLNQTLFRAGDQFILTMQLLNPGEQLEADLYVVLDAATTYWSYPSWRAGIAGTPVSLESGYGWNEVLFDFPWPEGAGTLQSLRFWAALLDPETGQLIGAYDMVEFGSR